MTPVSSAAPPPALAGAAGDPGDTISDRGAAATGPAGPWRIWRRPWVLLRYGAGGALLVVAVIYFVVPELRQAQLSRLAYIGVPWLITGALVEGLSLLCYSLLTRSLLPAAGPGLFTVFRIDMSCTALGHVVPAGSAASAALGYRLFTSRGVRPADACFMMASQGPGSSVVLNLLLAAALLVSVPLTGFHRIYLAAGLTGFAVLLMAAGLIWLLTRGEERVVRLARRVTGWIPRAPAEAAECLVRSLAGSIRAFRSDPRRMRRSVCWATANWLLGAASLWCFVASLGHYTDPVVLFAAFGIANVAAALPLTPSGLGVIEVTLPLLLAESGVTRSVAALAVIGWRLVNFWLPIPLGAAACLSLRLSRGSRARALPRSTEWKTCSVRP